jgi:hypothetical protein
VQLQLATWLQLTPNQAHFRYRIPVDVAAGTGNLFFGTRHQPESSPSDDGPWPFLAFLQNRNNPNFVTVHIYTIEFEELELKQFNPLLAKSGYLSLKPHELIEVTDLLLSYKKLLKWSTHSSEKTFQKLDSTELTKFNLRPEWFKETRCYLQIRNPLIEDEQGTPTKTILMLSGGSSPSSSLTFSIKQFPLLALEDNWFNLFDESTSKVQLDSQGLEDLAKLLSLDSHFHQFGS